MRQTYLGILVELAGQLGLLVWLLVSSVGQRLAFKNVGYVLGPYPYFVLLVISGAFVPIFGLLCSVIIATTGGFLPETRTWRCQAIYGMIGCCNGLQGASMVFANPHVAGYLQTLLQQAVIPFTMIVSAATLHARFSLWQYAGVLLIITGLFSQMLLPNLKSNPGDAISSGPWSFLFLLGQLPVAIAAVFQEQAFQAMPVNVFHMMFWASTAQFLLLLLLLPVVFMPWMGSAASMDSFEQNFADPWCLVLSGEAAGPLWGSIVAMFSAQLAQTFMVKLSSAAFTVLCLALVVPSSAAAFSSPLLMGAHKEHLDSSAIVALLLVFVGITCFRLGAPRAASEDSNAAMALLSEDDRVLPVKQTSPEAQPPLCTVGVGLIGSEYSNARGGSACQIWEERTLKEAIALSS